MSPPARDPDLASLSIRQRVVQALRCPFCHARAAVRASLVCARPGCGAVYHAECWTECLAIGGACAVLGCTSTEARPLQPAGYGRRLLRLTLSALLFPTTLVAGLRAHGFEADAARAAIRARAGASFERVREVFDPQGCLAHCFVWPLLGGSTVAGVWLTAKFVVTFPSLGFLANLWPVTIALVLVGTVLGLRWAAWGAVLALHWVRAGLVGELDALGRGDVDAA